MAGERDRAGAALQRRVRRLGGEFLERLAHRGELVFDLDGDDARKLLRRACGGFLLALAGGVVRVREHGAKRDRDRQHQRAHVRADGAGPSHARPPRPRLPLLRGARFAIVDSRRFP